MLTFDVKATKEQPPLLLLRLPRAEPLYQHLNSEAVWSAAHGTAIQDGGGRQGADMMLQALLSGAGRNTPVPDWQELLPTPKIPYRAALPTACQGKPELHTIHTSSFFDQRLKLSLASGEKTNKQTNQNQNQNQNKQTKKNICRGSREGRVGRIP